MSVMVIVDGSGSYFIEETYDPIIKIGRKKNHEWHLALRIILRITQITKTTSHYAKWSRIYMVEAGGVDPPPEFMILLFCLYGFVNQVF